MFKKVFMFLAFGRLTDLNLFGLYKMLGAKKSEFIKILGKNKVSIEGMSATDITKIALLFNDSVVRKGEIPSANCHGSARGMAKLASIMANQGQTKDNHEKNLMSLETWKNMHDGEKVAVDANILGMSKLCFMKQAKVIA